jgi:hypothetical protein
VRGRGQRGQTLIMFAITMTFVFLSLIALVGDADTLMVRYNEANALALLAAQTGAEDIDVNALYDPNGPRYQLATGPDGATAQCQNVPRFSNVPRPQCQLSGATGVTATVSWQVSLPIPLFMTTATVKATRTAQAVFGGAQSVTP